MIRLLNTIGVVVFLLGVMPASGGDEPIVAEVTFVTSKTVYVSAGREEGLKAGDRLTIMRDGAVIATAEVSDLSTHKSACKLVEGTLDPQVGDSVRIYADPKPEVSPERKEERKRIKPRAKGRQGIHGRVGLRYLAVADRIDGSSDYSQPALDFRLDGREIAGSAWGFAVDVRTRRTYRDLSDGSSSTDDRTRVYRMAVQRQGTEDPWTFTLGRQYSPALAAISIFDGASAQYGRRRWSAGMFTGSQPDASDYGYSGDIREHGAYVQVYGSPESRKRWQLTTGLIGSYEDSEINREFVYLQGRYNSRKLYAYLAQEVDYNRAWKSDAGEDRLSATSTFATVRYQVNSAFALNAGYDNRRNVRLYRDRVTPVTEFDDTYRRGLWLGTSMLLRNRYRLGLDARTSSRDDADEADTYTGTFAVRRITRHNFDVRTRSSRYTNERVEGWLHSIDAGVDVGSHVHLSVGGGTRREDNLQTIPLQSSVNWYGIDADLTLGRSWYLLFSAERTDGDFEEIDQFYASLTYRF